MPEQSPCANCRHLPDSWDECITTLWTQCWCTCGAGHKIVWQEWDVEGIYRWDGTGMGREIVDECGDCLKNDGGEQ